MALASKKRNLMLNVTALRQPNWLWCLSLLGLLLLIPSSASGGGDRRPRGQKTFTYFESFESALENTASDPRDINGNGIIDCGKDNDCTTITSCDKRPQKCDEWTLPLPSDPDLQFINEDASGIKISFKSAGGAIFPAERGTITVVNPGGIDICPSDVGRGTPVPVAADRLDWHIHTVLTPDIDGTQTNMPGSQPKAFRGQNSLHWGQHVEADRTNPTSSRVFGDSYCLQCLNAFVLDREGGLNLSRSSTTEQPLRLSFWHIAEFCDDECVETTKKFGGFELLPGTADDVAIVEVRATEIGTDAFFSPWERVEPDINPYDGTQDTQYFTPTYEPPDDTNPLSTEDPDTTMCSPLMAYIAQGSAKGTDPNCGDGDHDGFNDCGNVTSNTSRGEAGVGVWALTSFDLGRYAGKRIQVRFISTTLSTGLFTSYMDNIFESGDFGGPFIRAQESGDDGWYIDDIRVSGLLPEDE